VRGANAALGGHALLATPPASDNLVPRTSRKVGLNALGNNGNFRCKNISSTGDRLYQVSVAP
jgi:hypothetical protein